MSQKDWAEDENGEHYHVRHFLVQYYFVTRAHRYAKYIRTVGVFGSPLESPTCCRCFKVESKLWLIIDWLLSAPWHIHSCSKEPDKLWGYEFRQTSTSTSTYRLAWKICFDCEFHILENFLGLKKSYSDMENKYGFKLRCGKEPDTSRRPLPMG